MANFMARVAVTVLLLALAGCTYRPGADNPVARNLSWYSYVGAADIRAACSPGATDQMRLIYNGKYDEQVRSYDVFALADGGKVEVRARDPQDLTKSFELFDLFAPWRAEGRMIRIGAKDLTDLRRSLADSGLVRPAPDGLRLESTEHYWLANVCLDGQFTVNAWKYPSARFDALSFPAVLLRIDATGIALNPPQPANQYIEEVSERHHDLGFVFEVQENRLVGSGAAFGK